MSASPGIQWNPYARPRVYLWFCTGRYFSLLAIYGWYFYVSSLLEAEVSFAVACGGAGVTCLLLGATAVGGLLGRPAPAMVTVGWFIWLSTLLGVALTTALITQDVPLMVIALFVTVIALPSRAMQKILRGGRSA